MQSSATILASVANDSLALVSQHTVVPGQRSFIAGRSIADNVLEVEGALCEPSQLLESLPVIILFDFSQAFPSLSRSWMWTVLGELGVNQRLVTFIQMLDGDLCADIFHGGMVIAAFAS